MIYLDDKTDSILPYGLKTTPFETVYKALQAVASTVWPVDAAELRAAVGWGWYLVNAPDKLAGASAGRVFVQNALISEGAPLVKATQTQAELVDLLARWRAYRPTFGALEGLYLPYAATVDVRPITDAATQAILPVTDIHGAFYVVITEVDWTRPLTLDEAVLIAERATPMGSRPIALYGFEEQTDVTATAANGDAWVYVDSVEIAQDPPEPPVTGELTAYFTSQGASATSDKTMTFGTYQLYDSSGAVILSDDNHTYAFVKAYDYAGNEVAVPSAVYAPVFNNSGTLCLGMHPNSFTAYRLTYTVSNNT